MDDRSWLLASVPEGSDRAAAAEWFGVVLAAAQEPVSFPGRLAELAAERGFAAVYVEGFLARLPDHPDVGGLLHLLGPEALADEYVTAGLWHWDTGRAEWPALRDGEWQRQITEDGHWKLDASRTAWVPVDPGGPAAADRFLAELLGHLAAALPGLAQRLELEPAEVTAVLAAIPAGEVAETIANAVHA